MTSSSSSDDENLEMLQEAVDLRFINDSMYKNGEISKFLGYVTVNKRFF